MKPFLQSFYCNRCGATNGPFVSNGLCRICYIKDHYYRQRGHLLGFYTKTTSSKKRKPTFSYNFTPVRNSLRKLVLVVAHKIFGWGNQKVVDKIEKAKNFLRSRVCPDCRSKYISQWNNDFVSMRVVLCDACQHNIIDFLKKGKINRRPTGFGSKAKKAAIQYELEFRSNKPINRILRNWYVKERKSSYEIEEILRKDFNIYDITYRGIELWLDKLGILRSHVKAIRNRVVTGRMDYSRRKIDYTKRKQHPRKYYGIKHEFILIHAPSKLIEKIKEVANKTKRTASEVVRDIYFLMGKDIRTKSKGGRWHILRNGIKRYEDVLLRKRISARRGIPIILCSDETTKESGTLNKTMNKTM